MKIESEAEWVSRRLYEAWRNDKKEKERVERGGR